MLQLMVAAASSDRWSPSVTLRATVQLPACVKVNGGVYVLAE
jgi:hypothetical protein